MLNCLIAGVGGQGTVLASRLLAQAALNQGLTVLTAETIGMAQRGGSVVSHVRIGDGVCSPLISQQTADLIIGFEPAEAVRCLHYLKPGGTVLVNTRAIRPVTASLSSLPYDSQDMLAYLRLKVSRLIELDGDELTRGCGTAKVLNVALLGAAVAAGSLPLTLQQLDDAVRSLVPARLLDLNLQAVQIGAAAVGEKQP